MCDGIHGFDATVVHHDAKPVIDRHRCNEV